MTKFQLIFTIIFGIFILAGVIVFATFKGGDSLSRASLTVWGTLPQNEMVRIIAGSGIDQYTTVEYKQKKEESFDKELTEALAEGRGPDIFLLKEDSILRHRNKVYVIPFERYPLISVQNNFVDEAEIFVRQDGLMAIPFTLDPLVLYWNKDTFQNAELLAPPKYWDEFFVLTETLTEKDLLDIKKSAVALGTHSNINNAKQIIVSLLIQTGNPIVSRIGGVVESSLREASNSPASLDALKFYTEFSNPVKNFYSWNTSLPDSKEFFVEGDLATYIGFASELEELQKRNPNLRIGVAQLPQLRGSKNKATYAKLYGVAISKSSKNINDAFTFVNLLTSEATSKKAINDLRLPSVRRSLLTTASKDPALTVFNQSAIFSKGWMDPNRELTGRIFKELVENITSGKLSIDNSIMQAGKEMEFIISSL